MLRVGEHIYRLNFKQSPCSNYAHNIMPAEPRSTVYRKWPLSIVFDKSRLSRYYYIKPDVGQRRVNMHNYVPFDRGGCIVYEREREREREIHTDKLKEQHRPTKNRKYVPQKTASGGPLPSMS